MPLNEELLNHHLITAIQENNAPIPQQSPQHRDVWVLRYEGLNENIYTENSCYWNTAQKVVQVKKRFVVKLITGNKWTQPFLKIGQYERSIVEFTGRYTIEWSDIDDMREFLSKKLSIVKIHSSELPTGVFRG